MVDFVVLETEIMMSRENKISVILGQPFLTTSNAPINCSDRKWKLTFGNMTIELNVFNVQKQPMGFENVEYPTLN